MKMKERKWKPFILALVLGLMLTGCGSSRGYSESAAADTAAYEKADAGGAGTLSDGFYSNSSYGEAAPAEEAEAGETMEESSSSDTPAVQDTGRKLIRNVNLEVETETFDELLTSVQDKIKRLGGYIEESYTYNGSSYYGQDARNADLTIRIPSDKLDEFLADVAEISNIIRRNESVTDVTLQYVDMESHKKVLLTEQERLIELLGRAETIEDIISLESRLSEVRYQIESMEAQLRTLDNQVNYSTVYLYINEVKKLTPVKEQSVWERIATGFENSLYDVGKGIVDFAVGLLIDLPYIVVWAVVIVLAVLIIRLVIRRVRRRKAPGGKEKKRFFPWKRKQQEADAAAEEIRAGSADGETSNGK